jgi:hypothetical protein
VTTGTLEVDGCRLEVDARRGARVISLRWDGLEVLSGPDVDADNYGSTFWTSPQSDWTWPPPEEIDRAPYAMAAATDVLTFTGPESPALGVRVTKRFRVDRAKGAFSLEYGLHNVGAEPRAYAPWEVTRVPAGGLTLVPGRPSSGPLPLEEREGACWYRHAPGAPVVGQKAFTGGQGGLLAHVHNRLLFVKRFAPVPPEAQAPGEAAVEIYACPRYVELEVQGPYARIEPGDSASWMVTWYLRKLPDHIVVSPGSLGLSAFALRV